MSLFSTKHASMELHGKVYNNDFKKRQNKQQFGQKSKSIIACVILVAETGNLGVNNAKRECSGNAQNDEMYTTCIKDEKCEMISYIH